MKAKIFTITVILLEAAASAVAVAVLWVCFGKIAGLLGLALATLSACATASCLTMNGGEETVEEVKEDEDVDL